MRRDGELEVRPGYSALGMGEYGGSDVTAYDVANYDGRLVALGKASQTISAPLSIYEYVDSDAAWKGRDGTRLPYLTHLKDVARPPEQSGGVAEATCAVANGIGCLVYENAQSGDAQSYVQLFKPSTRQLLQFERMTGDADDHGHVPKVVYNATDDQFIVIGLDESNAIGAVAFDADGSEWPGTGNTTELLTGLDAPLFACCAVTGASGYVIAAVVSGDLIVRHYNASHVQQMTVTISTVAVDALAVEADFTANRVTIAYELTSDASINVRCIQLDDGSAVDGPRDAATGQTGVNAPLSIARAAGVTTQVFVGRTAVQSGAAHNNAGYVLYSHEAGSVGSGGLAHDAQMSTQLALSNVIAMHGYVQGSSIQRTTGIVGYPDAAAMPLASMGFGLGAEPTQVHALSFVQDSSTGYWYMVRLETNNNLETAPIVTEMRAFDTGRRQMAEIGGLLFISGGMPCVYDGVQLVESGFATAPRFYSLDHVNGSGGVTSEASYHVQGVVEALDARGNLHLSVPSEVQDLTTDAGDDTITGSMSMPLTMRREPSVAGNGSSLRGTVHRTAALADGTTGENLFFDVTLTPARTSAQGVPVSLTLSKTDQQLRDSGDVIYTQSQTPVPHAGPGPCRYCWPTRERLGIGGLPSSSAWAQSKLLFPNEAVQFAPSGRLGFSGRVAREVLAVAALDDTVVAFTDRAAYGILGEGPDHSGQGEFRSARRLPCDVGVIDADGWRSIAVWKDGASFQAAADRLELLKRDGSNEWIGQAVRDELDSYPVVTAALYCKAQHCVAFACVDQEPSPTDGVVLILDLRSRQWFVDPVGVVTSMTELDGRIVLLQSGAVLQQDAAAGTGSMPTQVIETKSLDFGSGLSWGEVLKIGFLGQYQGDSTWALAVTYDDGANYTTIMTVAVTAANGYSAGDPIELTKAPPERKCSRIGWRLTITGSTGSVGGRVRQAVLDVSALPGLKRMASRDTH
jgi:hypothetical protein